VRSSVEPGPMALDRPYPNSRRPVATEVGSLSAFVDASLRIGGRCRILQGMNTYEGIEVTRFGSS
jgi:hypothetical protein